MPDAPTDIAATLHSLNAQVLVRGWLSANNIVFTRADGGQVVDTGYVSHAAQTLALVEQALGDLPLTEVLNTHLHSDHCGGNTTLARRWPGLRLRVPAASRDKVAPWDDSRLSYRETGQRCEPFEVHGFLSPGDQVPLGGRDWEVHGAGGHDPDAVLLFEPASRTLVSGDALWERRLAIIFPELADEPGFDAAAQTLDAIERLAPRLVLPGHGQPFTDVAGALAASRQRLAAFAAAPVRHRQHAARALVVYHLLEHRARPLAALTDWVAATPIFLKALQCSPGTAQAREAAARVLQRLELDAVVVRQPRAGEDWLVLAEDA